MTLNEQINEIVADEIRDGLTLEEVLNQIEDAKSDAPVIYERTMAEADTYGARVDAAWEAAE